MAEAIVKVPAKPAKPARKSLTVWLNALAVAAGLIATLDPAMFAPLGPQAMTVIAALIAAANLYLRFRKELPAEEPPAA